jgi:hypothetical protein
MTSTNRKKHNVFVSIMIGDDNLSMHVDIQAGPGLQQQQLTEEEAGLQLVEQAGLDGWTGAVTQGNAMAAVWEP